MFDLISLGVEEIASGKAIEDVGSVVVTLIDSIIHGE